MTYREMRKHLRLRLSLAQHRACIYLERHGYVFTVHYGYANAVEMAKQHRAGWRLWTAS